MIKRSQRGFTLVEIMIALGLLAMMGVAIARSMAISFETKEKVSKLNDRYHEGRQVMNRMARELRMSFLRADVPRDEQEERPSVQTRFKGEEDELYFASTSHIRIYQGAKESDQCEIAYFLKRGDRDSEYEGKTLYRRESLRIDGDPEKGGYIWPVIEGVKSLQIEYWDETKEIGDDAWQRSWNSHENENEPLLPSRVRITMELSNTKGKPPIRFVTQANPRIRRPINVIESQAGRR